MKKVYQQFIQTETPDCMRACVASIFEKDLEDVPNFYTSGPSSLRKVGEKYLWNGWINKLEKYCVGLGKVPQFHNTCMYKRNEYSMIGVCGFFEDRAFHHALVAFNKEVVHCPSGLWDETAYPFPMKIVDYSKISMMNHIWSVSFTDILSLRKEIWLRK